MGFNWVWWSFTGLFWLFTVFYFSFFFLPTRYCFFLFLNEDWIARISGRNSAGNRNGTKEGPKKKRKNKNKNSVKANKLGNWLDDWNVEFRRGRNAPHSTTTKFVSARPHWKYRRPFKKHRFTKYFVPLSNVEMFSRQAKLGKTQ